ncbi:hypothetical protein BKA66DRAFT_474831 [Pyrenochaeta sp. MPI-SDFR-AT-0127]|nr:hypothetical protein BKA66DRAFT_474831 [Pyrenochaeta sp. MPI-SDFR-AT-0127]
MPTMTTRCLQMTATWAATFFCRFGAPECRSARCPFSQSPQCSTPDGDHCEIGPVSLVCSPSGRGSHARRTGVWITAASVRISGLAPCCSSRNRKYLT